MLEDFPDVTETVELVELDDREPVIKRVVEDDEGVNLEETELVAFFNGAIDEDVLIAVESESLLVRETDKEVDVFVPIIMPVPDAKGIVLLLASIEALGWNLRERP